MSFTKQFSALFEVLGRWYVFVFLNVYGLGKIAGMQFYRRGLLYIALLGVLLFGIDQALVNLLGH